MKNLRVPGTTVTITLLPGFVEVRDRGLIKKKIKVRNRGFDEVLDELSVYFKFIGKRLPPGVLEESLITIGVPRAKRIISEEVLAEEKAEEVIPETKASQPPAVLVNEAAQDSLGVVEEKLDIDEDEEIEEEASSLLTTKKSIDVRPGEVTVIEDQDLPDIEDALTAVESLSDSFMAPTAEDSIDDTPPKKPQIRISLIGSNEVKASTSSTPTAPNLVVDTVSEIESEIISEPVEEIPIVETYEDLSLEPKSIEPKIEDTKEEETEVSIGSIPLEEAAKPKERATPSHAVRPLVSTKVVILGEDGVGKHSILEKAGLKIQDGPEIDGEPKQHIRSAIFRLEDYRVDVNVWSFDDAVKMKVSRKEFYDDTHVIIIVYSVADRWSFESIDFWLKESTVKSAGTPPIIIVGNKKDLRDAGEPDPLEPPVSSEEGFKLGESLAKKLGEEGKLHPVAFIETSCLTGEGTEDVFRTAGQFYTNTL